jgi:hypothetical protein
MKHFKSRRPHPALNRTEALNFRPAKNRHITEERIGDNEVVIAYPMTVKPWVSALLQRFGGRSEPVRTKKLQLDELGTSVWDMVDGQRSVREIVAVFAATHRLERKEAEVSVTHFLRMLGQRGLIGMR